MGEDRTFNCPDCGRELDYDMLFEDGTAGCWDCGRIFKPPPQPIQEGNEHG